MNDLLLHNRNVFRLFTIFITALLVDCVAQAQSSWRMDKLGVEDGLSEGYVYVIHQDKKGFIWIGTHGGLNRYDGYSFRIFQYDPFNFSTLGDNAVFFLKEDSISGKFWIGGSSCLNEFDPETFSNTRYRYEQKQLEFSDGIFVSRDELLLACEYGVLLFDTREKKFLEVPLYDENNNSVSVSRVENLSADRHGNVMVMSKTGVFFYDHATKSCNRKTSASPDLSALNTYEVFNVMQDSQDNYWIATNKKGVIRFDASTKTIASVSLATPFTIGSLRFDLVIEDSGGNIWAGSSQGLFRIDPATLKATFLSSDNEAFRQHPEINVVTEDRNHFIWLGTVGTGIFKMVPLRSGFRNFDLLQNNGESMTGTYVMATGQMGHNIWFANIWDQVGKIDMHTGKMTLLSKPLLPESYSWYSEGAIVRTKAGELILLNGEQRYDISEDQAGAIAIRTHTVPGLSNIYCAKNNTTWYFVKAAVEKTHARGDTIFGNQFFYDATEDNDGNIWMGSSRGLIKFDVHQNLFTHYRHDDNNRNSVSSDLIYALETDDGDQTIWMAAYNGGLCSYNIPSGTFRHYGREDGLSDNTVYSIEKDNHGNLWFSSNNGISAYNVQTKTFRNYSIADGLLNHEFNRRASFKNDEGWLFFGGMSGIDYFHPDSIARNTTTPALAFTNFTVFNRNYIAPEKKDVPVIELQPGDRLVTVAFASLVYHDQQKIQYAYRLDNHEWIKTGNQHVLSFTDLARGHHQLSVRSTDSEGIWLDNDIRCSIVVHPWWWQTRWFRTSMALLGMALVFFGFRFYYHRKLEKQKVILERQQAVEKERTRIATDMHDDLGASLSRIKFLSDTIGIKKQKQESLDNEISSIRRYAHEMIDKMGEIVWALNEKNDSLSDLLAYTRSYAVEYLSQNGIRSNVHTPEEIPDLFVSGEFRRNVYLTVKEALHNIVKHAHASEVSIYVDAGTHLHIGIRDNGKGFDETKTRPFSSGLGNMKKRIASLGGTLTIKKADGSTVTLVVPLP